MISLASVGQFAGLGIAAAALVRVTWGLRADARFPIGHLLQRELRPSVGSRVSVPLALAAGGMMVVGPAVWSVLTGEAVFALQSAWSRASLTAILATMVLKLLFVLFEELAFRSALIGMLSQRLGTVGAVAVSALAFGVAHGRDVTSTLILIVDGIGFGAAYVATRSLRASVAWHAAKNLAVWLLLGSSTLELVPGPLRLTPADAFAGEVPPPAVTFMVATLVVAGMSMWLWAHWTARRDYASELR